MNGFTSPLTGLTTVMADEDRLAQMDFTEEYIADLAPHGAVERQMARTLAIDNWRLNRIKAVEENIFAWGYEAKTGPRVKCEIQLVENALTHAISYINHSKVLNDLSLYESRLTRIIARNHDLLMKRQDHRLHLVKQTHPAQLPETRVRTAGATARTNGLVLQVGQALSPPPPCEDAAPGSVGSNCRPPWPCDLASNCMADDAPCGAGVSAC
jgi:hypothetical protein